MTDWRRVADRVRELEEQECKCEYPSIIHSRLTGKYCTHCLKYPRPNEMVAQAIEKINSV